MYVWEGLLCEYVAQHCVVCLTLSAAAAAHRRLNTDIVGARSSDCGRFKGILSLTPSDDGDDVIYILPACSTLTLTAFLRLRLVDPCSTWMYHAMKSVKDA